jgi:hypothetical protein
MACVQCHTHPYDPFVHEEYYKAAAFFNNTRDEDTPGEHPNLRIYDEEDNERLNKIRTWVRSNAGPEKEAEVTHFLKTLEPKFHPHDFDQFVNGELVDNKYLGIRSGGSARVKQIYLEGKTNLIMNYWTDTEGGSFEIRRDALDGDVIASGKLSKGGKAISVPVTPSRGRHDLYISFKNNQIKPDWSVCLVEWFAFREELPGKGSKDYESINKSFLLLVNASAGKHSGTAQNDKDLCQRQLAGSG